VAYATQADAELLYGVSYVAVACDRNLDGTLDASSFTLHLAVATDTMDGYLLGRYPLPLLTPPAIFKKLCVDIAIYNAVPTADVRTLEMRARYDDAIRYMELLAANKIKLKIDVDVTVANASQQSSTTSRRQMSFDCGAREFRADNLRKIL
jgi:phage gp36-like protein